MEILAIEIAGLGNEWSLCAFARKLRAAGVSRRVPIRWLRNGVQVFDGDKSLRWWSERMPEDGRMRKLNPDLRRRMADADARLDGKALEGPAALRAAIRLLPGRCFLVDP